MKKLRVMALMDEELVPPDTIDGVTDDEMLDWKSEYDVVTTLRDLGHQVLKLGVSDNLGVVRDALLEWNPHITFNLLEEFHGVAVYDQHVAAYLELMKQPYTGCNPRGLMLAHDKTLSKQLLQFHRIPTPRFALYPMGKSIRPPRKLNYPLFVKSATEDASFGLTQESIVETPKALLERVEYYHEEIRSDALVEEFIAGREFYVGVLGNQRLRVLPTWELKFTKAPLGHHIVATNRVKWDYAHQEELGVETVKASLSPEVTGRISRLCRRIYRALSMSGYGRIDFRMSQDGQIYVLEANPNPNLSYGEDFAESAESAGISYEALIQRILRLGLQYRPAWQLTG